MTDMVRFRIGRALIHLGLWALPPGRVKCELYALVDQWATKVRDTLRDAALSRSAEG